MSHHSTQEQYFQAFPGSDRPYISLGLPFEEACKKHAASTFNAERVYIIVSNSISKTNDFIKLKNALGHKVVGIRYGIRQHVPWQDVLEIAQELHDTKADLLVTVGAGSLTDGAKVAVFAAANSSFTKDSLSTLHDGASPKPDPSTIKAPEIPIITIPTSLSGGEYTAFAGATNLDNHQKCSFSHPRLSPALVILDPVLCTTTPQSVWLASGMRAVDHCVEGLTSVFFAPESNASQDDRDRAQKMFLEGLKFLLPGLLATKKDAADEEARKKSMLGVVAAMRGFKTGAAMGASHGIGHQLGPLGVGHGETSCIMLPAVLRWNLKNGGDWVTNRQKIVFNAFWEDEEVAGALMEGNVNRDDSSTGDVVKAFVQKLGLPSSLKDVDVGPEKFDGLAKNALQDNMTAKNPVTIKGPQQVMEILQLAKGD